MTNYFSHDYSARNDIKLQALVMNMGYEGLGFYWCIVEMLYEQGSKMELSQTKSIAFSLRTTEEKINQLIDIAFLKDENFFWSETITKRLRVQKEKASKARMSAANKWGSNLLEKNKKNRSQRLSIAREKASHTKEEWEEMKLFFNNTCVKCLNASNLNGVVKDHIIPIYQEGSDGLENIQPLCAKCNASKGPETTDYRANYCLRNNLEMPTKWLPNAYETPAIKEKESKVNKRKEESVYSTPQILDDFIFLEELQEKFPDKDVNLEIEKMKDWFASSGSKKKDYAAFARNWLRKSDNKISGGLKEVVIRPPTGAQV